MKTLITIFNLLFVFVTADAQSYNENIKVMNEAMKQTSENLINGSLVEKASYEGETFKIIRLTPFGGVDFHYYNFDWKKAREVTVKRESDDFSRIQISFPKGVKKTSLGALKETSKVNNLWFYIFNKDVDNVKDAIQQLIDSQK